MSSDYDEYCFLQCDATQSGKYVMEFRSNMLSISSCYFSLLKMGSVRFSETSVGVYETNRRHIAEGRNNKWNK